ncbi:hypothetical protein D3C76_850700 [compost metagenome]
MVGGDHGYLGLLVAGQQAVELAQRAEGAAAEHVTGDQAAHAQVAVDDQVDTHADHRHACQLLDQHGDVHRQARQHLHAQFQAAEGAEGLLPHVLAFAFGVVDLYRIQAGKGLDQAGLALRGQGHGPLHGRHQWPLQGVTDAQGQREGDDRDPHQVPANDGDDDQDQDGERQVDQAGQGQRGEEVTQALEFVNVLGKAADPGRAVLHRHADDTFEQRGRDDQVGLLAGQVQAQAAQALQDQVEDVGAGDTDSQHPKRRSSLVGHHPVVHVHHEQRRGQGDQVDHQAGGDGVDVQPAAALERVAEPRAGAGNQVAVVDVELVLRLREEHPPTVVTLQRLATDMHLAAIALAEQQPRGVVIFPTEQYRAATVLEQQHRRHGDARDLLQLALQQTPLQTGTGRRTRQQLRAQALGRQRQAGGQHRPAGGLLVQHAEGQQAVQQRIIVLTAWIMAELDSTDF